MSFFFFLAIFFDKHMLIIQFNYNYPESTCTYISLELIIVVFSLFEIFCFRISEYLPQIQ